MYVSIPVTVNIQICIVVSVFYQFSLLFVYISFVMSYACCDRQYSYKYMDIVFICILVCVVFPSAKPLVLAHAHVCACV
jgi:hypothetical protein